MCFFSDLDNKNVVVSGENELIVTNLKMEDTSVIQCNATNKHGYIFANAYLKVGGKSQLHLFSFCGSNNVPDLAMPSTHVQLFSHFRQANIKCEFSEGPSVILGCLRFGYFSADFITISVISFWHLTEAFNGISRFDARSSLNSLKSLETPFLHALKIIFHKSSCVSKIKIKIIEIYLTCSCHMVF